MTEIQAEALSRAKGGQSMTNYPAIYTGFMAKGIPEAEIKPRENVLTFQAWKAVGRCVRKGEHGVKVVTYVPMKNRGDDGFFWFLRRGRLALGGGGIVQNLAGLGVNVENDCVVRRLIIPINDSGAATTFFSCRPNVIIGLFPQVIKFVYPSDDGHRIGFHWQPL